LLAVRARGSGKRCADRASSAERLGAGCHDRGYVVEGATTPLTFGHRLGGMAKKLRCYLGLHRYQRRVTDDGKPYKECRDCGKFLDLHDPYVPPAAV